MSNYFSSKQTRRKASLLLQLLIIMWYYPGVWVLGAAQVLDVNYTYAAYMIGSIFGKVIFSSLVIESHVTLLYEYLITSAKSTNMGEEDRLVDVTSPTNSAHRRSIKIACAPAPESATAQVEVGTITTIKEDPQEV
jgi:hypothetical protein